MSKNNIRYQILYGIHPLQECLYAKKRKIYELYIDENRQQYIQNILKQIPAYTKISFVRKNILDKMTGFEEHQGIAAYVSPFTFQKNLFAYDKKSTILFCDSIQDTKNLGGLLRSAYCTGITKVILTIKNSAPLTAATFKASAGLAEHLQIYRTENAIYTLAEFHKQKYRIVLAAANGTPFQNMNFEYPLIIVIGNEHTGIQKKLFEYGSTISLSQSREDISYNASVAGGILLYHLQYMKTK